MSLRIRTAIIQDIKQADSSTDFNRLARRWC
jgi:hypothetical protein